ncbi:MAG: PIN domain-containing protein [Verrucomicrobia bacterium]|jgi:predicted nucleic acid-binding protein|nr:PIN domain-containing protein [Verrucomicrobiota bacterium]
MEVFYDTSVIVPLLLEEDGSAEAVKLWERTTSAWAWEWAQVECEAALGRRKAGPAAWADWRALARHFRFLELSGGLAALCECNRFLGLRAADAGHVFVADRLVRVRPDCRLATFDEEMRAAAGSLGLRLAEADGF